MFGIDSNYSRYENLIRIIFLRFEFAPSPRSAGRVADLLFKFGKYCQYSDPRVKWTARLMRQQEQQVIDWFEQEEKNKENERAMAGANGLVSAEGQNDNDESTPASRTSFSGCLTNSPPAEHHKDRSPSKTPPRKTVSTVIHSNNNSNTQENNNNNSNDQQESDQNSNQNDNNSNQNDNNSNSNDNNQSHAHSHANVVHNHLQSNTVETISVPIGIAININHQRNSNVNTDVLPNISLSNVNDKHATSESELEEGEIKQDSNDLLSKKHEKSKSPLSGSASASASASAADNAHNNNNSNESPSPSKDISVGSDASSNDFKLQCVEKTNHRGQRIFDLSNDNVEIRHIRCYVRPDINNPEGPRLSYDWSYDHSKKNYDWFLQYKNNTIIQDDGNYGVIPLDTNIEVYGRGPQTSERKKWIVHVPKSTKTNLNGDAIWLARPIDKPEPKHGFLNRHFSKLKTPRMSFMFVCESVTYIYAL